MKSGKLKEDALKRSVLRQVNNENDNVIVGPKSGEDSAVFTDGKSIISMCTDPVIWKSDMDGIRAVYSVVNDLASEGADAFGVTLCAMLPTYIEEPQIKKMVAVITAECKKTGVAVLGGHTQITTAVNEPVITVSGVGFVEDSPVVTSGAQPGDDIVVTKWVGLEGTARIAANKKAELTTRYPSAMIDDAADFIRFMSVAKEAAIAKKLGVHAMHDISEGGVFGALWELADASGVGLEIKLKDIPLKQETVEVCEFYGLNPYQLTSGGALLIACSDGEVLVHELEKNGIVARVIGRAVAGNDRVFINDDEIGYFTKPQADEIHRIFE